MKKKKNKFKRVLIIVAIVIATIFCVGYIGLKYLQHELEEKITGCKIESKDFMVTIPFEYVNNWIVVKVKVAGSDKYFPFFFDTGAQTVLLDSLLNEIGPENYQCFSFSKKSESVEHAFNNELLSLKQLTIGGTDFKDIGAISAKNSKWGMLNCVSAYGIIGYNMIQTIYSQIDYDLAQITLTDKLENFPNYNQIQWIDYKPSSKQESPIIKAVINDSIEVKLFFDTGSSGGITLQSGTLYNMLIQTHETKALKYYSKPSIRIRGESNETKESIVFNATKLALGNIISENVKITVQNEQEKEYTGFIGNKYLENYVITLDFKNRRIGFIPKNEVITNNTTFGVNYIASGNNITVSSVFENSKAYKLGIRPGDELYSINGIKVSDLNANDFCKIYRDEYKFQDPQDSILTLEIIKDNKLVEYVVNKYTKF